MTPEKAHKLGMTPDDLDLISISGKYKNEWIVFYWDERVEPKVRRVVASGDIFSMSHWMANFRKL